MSDILDVFRDEIMRYYEVSAKGNGGWQKVARMLGTSKGAAYNVAHGIQRPTKQQVLNWMAANKEVFVPVRVCPDCGSVHTGRCHGKLVADVVTLEPGQHVISPLPHGYLLAVNGTVQAVRCNADIRQCGCGEWFVARSWNQKRCQPKCKEAKA